MKFLRTYWPSIIVLAVILYATLFPKPLGDEELPLFPGADKLVHAVMFGGLTGALVFDYMRSHNRRHIGAGLVIAFGAGATVLGGVIEIVQGAMDCGRSADWLDLAADGLGAVVAMLTAPKLVARVLRNCF